MTETRPIYVDLTHCGRHVTGLERIALELFSADALAPLPIIPVRSTTRLGMVWRQQVQLPLMTITTPGSLLLCPGFPPSHLATMLGGRVLPYVHDLFLITRHQDLNIRARLLMAAPFRFAVSRLRHFLVNSQTTADELRRFCRTDARITLYRPKVANVFSLSARERASRSVHSGPALVALGTIEPRKNLFAAAAVITALRAQGHADAQLDIVGRAGWGVDLQALSAVPGVTLHGYQPAPRVQEIVDASDALISTSHDEGLGLPLLETQYAGLMVIAPDMPVFREVLGRSGILIDWTDPQSAARKIADAMSVANWRGSQAGLAIDNLTKWNHAAGLDRANVLRLLAAMSGQVAVAAC